MHKRDNTVLKQSGKGGTREFKNNTARALSPGASGHYQMEEGSMEDHQALLNRIATLELDLERRQISYVGRERDFKQRIDELEEELDNQRREKTGWMKSDSKMTLLKSMQGQILQNVEHVQDRTAKILQEQERDLLRAFRARLFDVQTELEKEKSKKDDGAGAWIERSRQLEAEVEWAKEVADRLERHNQTLTQDNNRLKSQFDSQEEDRNFIIKQLVAVKKDNAKLRAEYTAVEEENENLKGQVETLTVQVREGGSANNASANKSSGESEERLKELYARTRRMLAEERKALQTVRLNYANELKARTEMELLLRQAVDDVRKEIARRNIENSQFSRSAQLSASGDNSKMYSRAPGTVPIEEFSQEDRERALELLLSQERVVTLLYAKAFPLVPSQPQNLSSAAPNTLYNNNNNNMPSTARSGKGSLLTDRDNMTDDGYNNSNINTGRPLTAESANNDNNRPTTTGNLTEKSRKLPLLSTTTTNPARPGTGGKNK